MSTAEKPATTGSTAGSTTTMTTADKPTLTEYVVLVQMPDGNWKVANTLAATGSTAAIKAHIGDGKDAKVSALVAVPARSWQPVKPKTKTTTTTILEAL